MSLHPVKPAARLSRHSLELWLDSPRGRALLALEEAELKRVLPDVFGRHLLQIGDWGREAQLLASAETLHHAVLGGITNTGNAATIDPHNLPLANQSVDALLLPHTLEFSASPHTVLREASRVLNDRGRLFVLGFNPYSPWALRARLGLRYAAFPASARPVSNGRLTDWLQLLDFEVTELRRFGDGFPWLAPRSAGEPWNPGSLFAPFAQAYLLVAKKRVLPVSLIGRAPRAQVKSLVGMPAPAARRDSTKVSSFPNPQSPIPNPDA